MFKVKNAWESPWIRFYLFSSLNLMIFCMYIWRLKKNVKTFFLLYKITIRIYVCIYLIINSSSISENSSPISKRVFKWWNKISPSIRNFSHSKFFWRAPCVKSTTYTIQSCLSHCGAARHCNAYIRFKIRVVGRGILGLNMCIAMFYHTKSDKYLILYI